MEVEEAGPVGIFLGDGVGFLGGVIDAPGELGEVEGVISEGVYRPFTAEAGVLPFFGGGKTVDLPAGGFVEFLEEFINIADRDEFNGEVIAFVDGFIAGEFFKERLGHFGCLQIKGLDIDQAIGSFHDARWEQDKIEAVEILDIEIELFNEGLGGVKQGTQGIEFLQFKKALLTELEFTEGEEVEEGVISAGTVGKIVGDFLNLGEGADFSAVQGVFGKAVFFITFEVLGDNIGGEGLTEEGDIVKAVGAITEFNESRSGEDGSVGHPVAPFLFKAEIGKVEGGLDGNSGGNEGIESGVGEGFLAVAGFVIYKAVGNPFDGEIEDFLGRGGRGEEEGQDYVNN